MARPNLQEHIERRIGFFFFFPLINQPSPFWRAQLFKVVSLFQICMSASYTHEFSICVHSAYAFLGSFRAIRHSPSGGTMLRVKCPMNEIGEIPAIDLQGKDSFPMSPAQNANRSPGDDRKMMMMMSKWRRKRFFIFPLSLSFSVLSSLNWEVDCSSMLALHPPSSSACLMLGRWETERNN